MEPIRGASGLNLMVHSSEGATPNDLQDCRNIDLSIENCVQVRRGLQRATAWPGLLYCDNGKLNTELATLANGPITGMYANPSAYVTRPGVET